MRTAALALALLSAAGCFYDSPNPWDTSSDRDDYREKKEQDWLLELQTLRNLPLAEAVYLEDPSLEGWRDTVLANADRGVLERMKDQSAQKLSALEGLLRSQGGINENNKEQITQAYRAYVLERRRHQLIEHRVTALSPQ
jgi:hypothetical protein